MQEEKVQYVICRTSNTFAAGPSGVGYKILRWAHKVCPDILTYIYNLVLTDGNHPWHHATIIAINKLGKPDYSAPKAHCPISLLECAGKLLEKIVTNQFQLNISSYQLISNAQFSS